MHLAKDNIKANKMQDVGRVVIDREQNNVSALEQCFSTAGPRPGTGPREVLLEFVILVF